MKRLHLACLLILLGVTSFGVAVGLVYIDERMNRIELVPGPEDPPSSGETPTTLLVALCIGPPGAAVSLVGSLLGVIEILKVRKAPNAAQ